MDTLLEVADVYVRRGELLESCITRSSFDREQKHERDAEQGLCRRSKP